ncbi:Kinesin-like protein KIP3 [Spathaspora sp. JA1]|nr:Kinesin-like protein KIP3 [Spathaspora sp. JA1]
MVEQVDMKSNSIYNSTSEAKQSSIRVSVRVRPFTESETNNLINYEGSNIFLGAGSYSSISDVSKGNNSGSNNNSMKKSLLSAPLGIRKIVDVVDDNMLIFDPPETNPLVKMQRNAFPNKFNGRIREHKFVFDKLFDTDASQDDVYHGTTRPLLDSILDGYNSTVFAYGATGCGKTHTISGTPEDPGVIFLTMKELYDRINQLQDTKLIELSLSYLEIYNETIRDLLAPATDFKKLIIREDENSKISVSNLSCHTPTSVEQVMQLILEGNRNRTSSPTEANATSSRSHAVLQINITQRSRTADVSQQHTFATLSIIDLAGSERAAATRNRGARLNEGANINKSLLALGNCINALCDPRRRNHIPYRDSKLTRLLKFSLGGNCKTVMIVCISPSSQHYDETLNTLKYADRAKEIKTKLIRNQQNLDRHVGSYLKMITEQKAEIEELRKRESTIIETTIINRKEIEQKTFALLYEAIDNIRLALNNDDNNQEKWKKKFCLAKRKLLLSQKIDIDVIMSEPGLQDYQFNDNNTRTVISLCEQLQSKLRTQIKELEIEYEKPANIDRILNESAKQTLKRLSQNEGWEEHHSKLFQQFVKSLRAEVDRDMLVGSSILHDSLLSSLQDFICFPRQVVKSLIDNKSQLLIIDVIKELENFLNGTFDLAIEKHTTEFVKNKLTENLPDDVDTEMETSMIMNDEDLKPKPSILKKRPAKRSPVRRMRDGPIIKSSPIRKSKKVVHWDVSKSDSTMMDSSMNESIQQPTKEDLDTSPITGDILDNLNDDSYFQLDSGVDSPPLPKREKLDPNILHDLKRGQTQSGPKQHSADFINRRLTINLNDNISLNKKAAIIVSPNTRISPNLQPLIVEPEITSSPEKSSIQINSQ